jgi:hypothetical protein
VTAGELSSAAHGSCVIAHDLFGGLTALSCSSTASGKRPAPWPAGRAVSRWSPPSPVRVKCPRQLGPWRDRLPLPVSTSLRLTLGSWLSAGSAHPPVPALFWVWVRRSGALGPAAMGTAPAGRRSRWFGAHDPPIHDRRESPHDRTPDDPDLTRLTPIEPDPRMPDHGAEAQVVLARGRRVCTALPITRALRSSWTTSTRWGAPLSISHCRRHRITDVRQALWWCPFGNTLATPQAPSPAGPAPDRCPPAPQSRHDADRSASNSTSLPPPGRGGGARPQEIQIALAQITASPASPREERHAGRPPRPPGQRAKRPEAASPSTRPREEEQIPQDRGCRGQPAAKPGPSRGRRRRPCHQRNGHHDASRRLLTEDEFVEVKAQAQQGQPSRPHTTAADREPEPLSPGRGGRPSSR